MGAPGKPISEIFLNLVKSQEEKANHFNLHKATRAIPCKPLAKGFLPSYQNNGLEQIADEVVDIWERLKADSPVYQVVESEITSSSKVEGGRLVRSHLKRYWMMGAAQTNRSVLNAFGNFAEFRKSATDQSTNGIRGSVLIFSEQRRSLLSDKYELAVENAD